MVRQEPRGAGRGSILNIASLVAYRGFEGVAAYGAAKAAVINFTQSLATDWAVYGIRVNAIAPGVFVTDLNRALVEDTPRGDWLRAHTGAAVYLCSDDAAFTTGAVIPVDGGFLAYGVGPRQQEATARDADL